MAENEMFVCFYKCLAMPSMVTAAAVITHPQNKQLRHKEDDSVVKNM